MAVQEPPLSPQTQFPLSSPGCNLGAQTLRANGVVVSETCRGDPGGELKVDPLTCFTS